MGIRKQLAYKLLEWAKKLGGPRIIHNDLTSYMNWDYPHLHPADAQKNLNNYFQYKSRIKDKYYTYRTCCHNGDHEWDEHEKEGWVYCWICGAEGDWHEIAAEWINRIRESLDQNRIEKREERVYTEREVELAYCTGIFNVSGIDGLADELYRLRELGLRPYDVFDKNKKE